MKSKDNRLRYILTSAMSLLDEDVYGKLESPNSCINGAKRIITLVEESDSDEIMELLSNLWLNGYHQVVTNIISEWQKPPPFEYDAKQQILDSLEDLWYQGNFPIISELLICWTKIASKDSDKVIFLLLPPFKVCFSETEAAKLGVSYKISLLLVGIGAMLCCDRIDRALDFVDELESYVVGVNEHLNAQMSFEFYLPDDYCRLFDEERVSIAKESLRIIKTKGKQSFEATDNENSAIFDLLVNVRCVACFGDWLDNQGFKLKIQGHSTWIDGSEADEGILQDKDGKTVGVWEVHYLSAHYFLRHFYQKEERLWDQLYVDEDNRENDDDPKRDFCVAVEPMKVRCRDAKLAAILHRYRGKYHGKIPQRAVQAYREYCH